MANFAEPHNKIIDDDKLGEKQSMSEELKKFSDALADAAAAVGSSVVRVDARHRLPATGIVWSADGLIVTASHVVQEDAEITVGLPSGNEISAALVGRDPSNDLALLRTDATELAVPPWADVDSIRAGQLALAVGRPGSDIQASLGMVRSPNAMVIRRRHRRGGMRHGPRHHGHPGHAHDHREEHGHEPRAEGERFILADVVMYPGFSGGPLVDASGQIIGMNTSAFRGAALTIPQSIIGAVVPTLVEYGRVRQGYLGISAQPARLPDTLADELDQETGLLIISVEPDSPSSRAELLLGDTIVGLDGVPTTALDELLGLLRGESVGQTVTATIVRGGELREIDVTIGERM